MIILVSDLHLMDDTLGADSLPPSAFEGTLKDLAHHAKEADARDIKIVFLGDVFDLIGTAAWFPTRARPWDSWEDAGTDSAPAKVLQGILEKNKDIGRILAGSLKAQFGDFPSEPERIYVPGNHDRLCNLDVLRPKVRDFLGCGQGPGNPRFENTFMDEAHGLFARHGHEWDGWNYEGGKDFSHYEYTPASYTEYMKPPIGDALTVEVASQLPDLVVQYLPASCPDEVKKAVRKHMCAAFDVRPLVAVIPWLCYQAQTYDDDVRSAIDKAMRKIAANLQKTPFVQQWMKRHDKLLNPCDDASFLYYLMQFFEHSGTEHLGAALSVFERVGSWSPSDNHASRAAEDMRRLDKDPTWSGKIRYVAYGHTHLPEQRAVEVTPDGRDCVYLNTGTWRPVYEQGLTKKGFMSWHGLTYTIIYKPGVEKVREGLPLDYPAFEVWTGGLKNF